MSRCNRRSTYSTTAETVARRPSWVVAPNPALAPEISIVPTLHNNTLSVKTLSTARDKEAAMVGRIDICIKNRSSAMNSNHWNGLSAWPFAELKLHLRKHANSSQRWKRSYPGRLRRE